MDTSDPLSCPQCGSHRTLGKLRTKHAEVKKRIADQAKPRYRSPPTPPTVVYPYDMHTHTLSSHSHSVTDIKIDPAQVVLGYEDGKDLCISTPGIDDQVGTVLINGALLDVCVDCGSFYAPNARGLGERLQTEIYELDPLGALAEIPSSDVTNSG